MPEPDYAPAIRYRLRDLDRRQRIVAALLALLIATPFVISVTNALAADWIPSGDDALVTMRAYDVFTEHRPLTGQPSTSHHYNPDLPTAHPGPIEFYAMAIPVRLFGPSVGMLAGLAAVNLGAVLLAAWVILRRAGPRVGLWGAVVLSGIAWSEGSFQLSDPISSNAGGIALVALAILAWAIVDGDVRLLPVTAFVASWVVQQHLAIVTPAASMAAWAGLGLAVVLWGYYRRSGARSEDGDDREVGPDAGAEPEAATEAEAATGQRSPTVIAKRPDVRPTPWLIGGLAVLFVCSLPMLIEQIGPAANMSMIVRYAMESDRETLGPAAGARQALRALGLPPLLLQSDHHGFSMYWPMSWLKVAGGLLVTAALIATAVVARRHRPSLAALSVTALVLAFGGLMAGMNIPRSIEAGRINFYRWTFVVAVCTWTALGWAAGLLYQRYAPPLPKLVSRLAPVLAIGVVAVAAIATSHGDGPDDIRRDETGAAAINAVADEVLRLAEGHDRVTVLISGNTANGAFAPAAVLQLVEAGHDVMVPGGEARFWGEGRQFDPDKELGLILQLNSRRGPTLRSYGRLALRYEMNPKMNDALPGLYAQLESGGLQPREHVVDGKTDPERLLLRTAVEGIDDRPDKALYDPKVIDLLLSDVLVAPTLDEDALRTMQEELPGQGFQGEDTFEVRVLTRAELRNARPDWFR